jgi:YbbR domain-containing protein
MNPPIRLRALRHAAVERFTLPSWGDVGTWLLAFATAVGLWAFVNSGERASERTLRFRLDTANLPAGMMITSRTAEQVEVRVSGAGIILSSIDAKRLRAVLDLSGVRAGVATYTLGSENFHLPRKVELIRVAPAQVSFHVDHVAKRSFPVRLEQRGELPAGLKLRDVQIAPGKVDVVGPETQLDTLRAVDTQPLQLASLEAGVVERELSLTRPGDLLQLKTDAVRVVLHVEPVMAQRELREVRIAVQRDQRPWDVKPEHVTVVVRGPESELNDLELPADGVRVDARGLTGNAERRVRPTVDLPPRFELVRIEPPEVVLRLQPGASAASPPRSASRRQTERR